MLPRSRPPSCDAPAMRSFARWRALFTGEPDWAGVKLEPPEEDSGRAPAGSKLSLNFAPAASSLAATSAFTDSSFDWTWEAAPWPAWPAVGFAAASGLGGGGGGGGG